MERIIHCPTKRCAGIPRQLQNGFLTRVMIGLFSVNALEMVSQLRRFVAREVAFGAFQRRLQCLAHVRPEMLFQIVEILGGIRAAAASIRMLFGRAVGCGRGRRSGGRRGGGGVIEAIGWRGGGRMGRHGCKRSVNGGVRGREEGEIEIRDGKGGF